MIVFVFFVIAWYGSLFFHSFFLHRYASHGAFKMSYGWERVFFVLSYLFMGCSYMSPRAYAIMHRLHHAHTDTEHDPHSPAFSDNMLLMVWKSRTFYRGVVEGTIPVDEKYCKNLPEWKAFDKWGVSWASSLLWIALYTVFVAYFASSPWMYLMVIAFAGLGVWQGAAINWIGHKFGYRNYAVRNTSRNLLPVDVLFLGESYHNNHHKFPSSANFGRKWHEIDPVYPVIRLFSWLRIIQFKTA